MKMFRFSLDALMGIFIFWLVIFRIPMSIGISVSGMDTAKDLLAHAQGSGELVAYVLLIGAALAGLGVIACDWLQCEFFFRAHHR